MVWPLLAINQESGGYETEYMEGEMICGVEQEKLSRDLCIYYQQAFKEQTLLWPEGGAQFSH